MEANSLFPVSRTFFLSVLSGNLLVSRVVNKLIWQISSDGFEHVCSMSAFNLHLYLIQILPFSERNCSRIWMDSNLSGV